MRNRKSYRLKGWDYSRPGYYFITICVKDFEPIFGRIESGRGFLSDLGKIADEEFLKSFEIRKELRCIEYIIMPDHIHMIIEIMRARGTDARLCPYRRRPYPLRGAAGTPPFFIFLTDN
jgi:putative transposase